MAKKAEKVEVKALPAGYVPALKKVYKEEIVDKLMKQFGYTTVMRVPKLVKITLNEGVGQGTQDRKVVEEAAEELALITGQKALITTSMSYAPFSARHVPNPNAPQTEGAVGGETLHSRHEPGHNDAVVCGHTPENRAQQDSVHPDGEPYHTLQVHNPTARG